LVLISFFFFKTASRYAVENGSENMLDVIVLRQSKTILLNCSLILSKHHLQLQFYQEGLSILAFKRQN